MKVVSYEYPKSSFLSLEKDLNIIVEQILKNDNLKRMLYYTSKDCLNRPILSEDETIDLFGKNIKLIPKLEIDRSILNYMIISFDNFLTNANNPQFRDSTISFDIICHFSQWQLKDFQLRPYRIAAELDSMFNNKRLTGIGTLQFLGAEYLPIDDEFAGVSLMYSATHGEEDKKNALNPVDTIAYKENFNKIFNND